MYSVILHELFCYRFILHAKKTAFVVEHDFIMATYLADRVIVFEGSPGIDTKANTPQALLAGMNKFLKSLDITFRRDPNNFRPRINKWHSVKVLVCHLKRIVVIPYVFMFTIVASTVQILLLYCYSLCVF